MKIDAKQILLILSFTGLLFVGHTQVLDIPARDKYQGHGDHFEGRQPSPVSGEYIQLVSAMAETDDPPPALADVLRIRYFLPQEADVKVTVREKLPRYYYLLVAGRSTDGKVQPLHGPKGSNGFQWLRSTVLIDCPDLHIQDLGVVAEVAQQHNDGLETVAPAIFVQGSSNLSVNGYVFTFTTSQDASVTCTVLSGPDTVGTQSFPRTSEARPYSFHWRAGDMKEGTYRLLIQGKFKNSNTEFAKTILFFHKRILTQQ